MKKQIKYAVTVLFLAAVSVGGLVLYLMASTPDFTKITSSAVISVRLSNGAKTKRRVGPDAPGWIALANIADPIIVAVVASEDTSFFKHKGIDLHEIKSAIKKDLKEKRFARGASTITQQVIKNVYLTHEKTLWRKIREAVWATELEKFANKSEILAFYLNMVEWGPGIYGVGEATNHYFKTTPNDISPKQGAFLAMLLPSPRKYHQYYAEKKLTPFAQNRINTILDIMKRMGYLDESAHQEALDEPLWS